MIGGKLELAEWVPPLHEGTPFWSCHQNRAPVRLCRAARAARKHIPRAPAARIWKHPRSRRPPRAATPRAGAPFFGLISIQKVTKSRNRAPRRRRSDPRRSCAARASPRGGRGMGGSISHARVARTAWRPRASAPSPSLNFRKLVTFQILEGNPVRVRQPSVGPKNFRVLFIGLNSMLVPQPEPEPEPEASEFCLLFRF